MCCFLRGGTFAAPNIPISRSEGLQTWQRRHATSDKKKKKRPNQRRLTPSCKLSADAVVVGEVWGCGGGVEGDGVRGRTRQAGGRQRVAFQHHGQRHAHWNGSAGCFKKLFFSQHFQPELLFCSRVKILSSSPLSISYSHANQWYGGRLQRVLIQLPSENQLLPPSNSLISATLYFKKKCLCCFKCDIFIFS